MPPPMPPMPPPMPPMPPRPFMAPMPPPFMALIFGGPPAPPFGDRLGSFWLRVPSGYYGGLLNLASARGGTTISSGCLGGLSVMSGPAQPLVPNRIVNSKGMPADNLR